MEPMTQPIRVVFNTHEKGYRSKTYLAYLAVFTLAAGDAVRYTIGWWGWGALLVLMLGSTIALLVRNHPRQAFGQVPLALWALIALMAASTIWSAYPNFTLLATVSQLATSLFGVFLAAAFSWRHLLKVFANVIRFILGASLLFEFVAAAIVQGPIAPIFKNYSGNKPPAVAFYWTQGNLFSGERIQGIVGNSNLLAYVAMIGIVVFAVEYAIIGSNRRLSGASLAAAILCIGLARSAGIGFAVAAILIAATVALLAEGKDRDTRHRYYRFSWLAAGIAGFFVLLYRAQVFEAIGKSPDMTGRSGIWKKVLHLIEQRPLQGWGWISHWMPGVKPYEGLVVINHVPYYQAHNAYLDVWLQLGMVGLALLLALITLTFIKLWRLAVRHTSALYLWPVLVFFGLLVQNLTESRMLIELGWVFLVLFAVKANDPDEALEPSGRTPKRVRLLYQGLLRNRSLQRKDR